MEEKLRLYLGALVANSGSDLHIKADTNIRIRVNGELKILGNAVLSAKEVVRLTQDIATEKQYEKLIKRGSIDFSYILNKETRFRVNVFNQMDGLSVVFRLIPTSIPTISSLELPDIVESFADISRGLVLITGVTGSGKSTTLASLINKINHTYSKHIITLEDPIEFVHNDVKCLINQRSMDSDFYSFGDALPATLREDPDVILIGEMRDKETMDLALHAANTGHLVFSTLHTLDAKETINRIIGMFPQEEQDRIRISLSSVLSGIVSQRLVPRRNGGRIVAAEIMVKTTRIQELIAENRDFEILDAIEDGHEIYYSQSFDQHLFEMVKNSIISRETALANATNPSDLKLKLDGIVRSGAKVEFGNVTEDSLDSFGFKAD